MKRYIWTISVVLTLVGLLMVTGACRGAKATPTPAQSAPAAAAQPAAPPAAPPTQVITWKVQTAFPATSLAHISYLELAKKIDAMSGGRLKWEVLPGGAIVPAFEAADAASKGVLDAAGYVPAYFVGKHAGASLFGTGPSFGMDAIDLLAWEYYGGGWQMYQELLQKELKLDLVGFHFGPIPTQPFGWFRKPVRTVDDIKGLKYRTVGLAAELFTNMGASVVSLAGGEIVPALERGVIDAAEWNNTTDDKNLGFPQVTKYYYLQSYHQPVEYLELLVNKAKWDALPSDLKEIVRYAIMAESADMQWRWIDLNSKDLVEIQKLGVQVLQTPPEILKAQLDAWDKIIEKYSNDPQVGPFFKRVLASQKDWASRVVPWKVRIYVPNIYAYEKYWQK